MAWSPRWIDEEPLKVFEELRGFTADEDRVIIVAFKLSGPKGFSRGLTEYALEHLGVPPQRFDSAFGKLRDRGLIVGTTGLYWYQLSPKARRRSEAWIRAAGKENAQIVFDYLAGIGRDYVRKQRGGTGTIEKATYLKHLGKDLLFHADDGEEDRTTFALGVLPNEFRMAHLTFSPGIREDFLRSAVRMAKKKTEFGVNEICIDSWIRDSREVAREIGDSGQSWSAYEDIADQPRRHLDIIMSCIPRIGIFQLYLALNAQDNPCSQTWWYNRAGKYALRKGKAEFLSYAPGNINAVSTRRALVLFGEEEKERLTTTEYDFKELIVDREMAVGQSGPVNKIHSGMDLAIQSVGRTRQALAELRVPKYRENVVDFVDIRSILAFLEREQPALIFLSGNRVAALAVARYWLHCRKNELPIPTVYFAHITAEEYSSGYREELLPILDTRPSDPDNVLIPVPLIHEETWLPQNKPG